MTESVRFEDVSLLYPGGTIPAVSHLDLTIERGEFLVLVGPSGCGKSTSLRMLAGLEPISDGKIFIGDRDVTHLAAKDRDIAMVFQNYALYPHMSVGENMAFALKIQKVSKDEIARRVTEAAALLDLTEYVDRKPKALSGGQRQRVAMGRAIVREPQVFLWMNRFQTLMQNCAFKHEHKSQHCSDVLAPPPSTSRTTRSRR